MIAVQPSTLADSREAIFPAMAAAVRRLAPEVRPVVEHHLGWLDGNGNKTGAGGGKALRATLALLSAEAVGSTPAVALPGAVAVELVHNFSLLHDDVMDGDRERRHRPTAWVRFGVGQAICAGDALLALAHEVLVERPGDERRRASLALAKATGAMIAGQGQDLAFERRLDTSPAQYMSMAAAKTGALLGCSASIGAVLAGAGPGPVTALTRFGCHLGLAFQMIDDLLGVWGRPDVTGKPVGSDIRAGKASLPIVVALRSDHPEADELGRVLPAGASDEATVARATALIESTGARQMTEDEAVRQLAGALECLETVAVPEAVRARLVELARFVVERDV
ncbi:MAG TPA: polyprenyl synthetase family protein [Acidimicrobiales bacterium]